jgi:hypothetical protein
MTKIPMPTLLPKVGMGATEIFHSDLHAYTIIRVADKRSILVQRDKVITVEGQDPIFERDLKGVIREVTFRLNGSWVVKGQQANGTKFILDERKEYYDPTF